MIVLHVESKPSSPDRLEEFVRWYDEVHIPEVTALEGFVGARRFAPIDDGGPFIVHYELEGDPHVAVDNVRAAAVAGRLNMSDVLCMDPIPQMHLLRVDSEFTAPK